MLRATIKGQDVILLPEHKTNYSIVPDYISMSDEELAQFNTTGVRPPAAMREWADRCEIWLKRGVLPVSKLFNKHKNTRATAVIIGAGPSLAKHNKYFDANDVLFGINRACSMVACDYNIALDPNCCADFYKGVGSLVVRTLSNVNVGDAYKSNKIYMINTALTHTITPAPIASSLGTLFTFGNTMQPTLHLAYLMGFRKIKLIGTDFGSTDKNVYYADGAPRTREIDDYLEVVDKGVTYYTTLKFVKHARNVAATMYWLKEHGVTFMNRPQGLLGKFMDIMKAIK